MWFASKYPCRTGDVDAMSTSPSTNLDDSQDEETEMEIKGLKRLERAFYVPGSGKCWQESLILVQG